LLKALPEILGQNERLHIAIAGGGETELLNEFRRCGPQVEVLGWVPFGEMQALYAASDLTLVPSIWHENSPVVIYQSLQVGTPAAASAIGGSPELIAPGETGYLYAPRDPLGLADSVRQHFSRSPHERRVMRQRCAEVALTRWSIERHINQHLALYHKVMSC
jgi:glycosyltransferase involved in cell wall biosynthesis